MKPADVQLSIYIDYGVEHNKKNIKFKIGVCGRIPEYTNISAKAYTSNWSEKVLVIKETKTTVPWTYVISDLNGENIAGTFYEKELQKTSQAEFRIEKVIKT